jgi:hypothetical protein
MEVNQMKVILISGKAQHGKDTSAEIIKLRNAHKDGFPWNKFND